VIVPLPTSATFLVDVPFAMAALDDAPGPYHINVQPIGTAVSLPAPVGELYFTYSVGHLGTPSIFGTSGVFPVMVARASFAVSGDVSTQ